MGNREMEIQSQGVKNNDERKRQVYELQRELLQERTKVKALSEELENPMNVHRWRKLEGSDPSQKEMLAKVKALQRRFIAKTEEAVEKEMLIHEQRDARGDQGAEAAPRGGHEACPRHG